MNPAFLFASAGVAVGTQYREVDMRWFITLLAIGLAVNATAAERQPLGEIRAAVEHFIESGVDGPGRLSGVRIDRLDPRLRLTRCQAPLSVWKPHGHASAGRLTLGVRCKQPSPWKVYVPVVLERRLAVVTLARPVSPGHQLSGSDLAVRDTDVARLRDDYFLDPEQVIGMEVRQSLSAGDVIGQRSVRAPRLVARGQSLVIEATNGSIAVNMAGEALQDGREDQRIRVRNNSSKRIIEARVVGRGRVRVTF